VDELFDDDAPIDDPHGDGEPVAKSQIKPVVDSTCHLDEIQFVEEKDEFFFFF